MKVSSYYQYIILYLLFILLFVFIFRFSVYPNSILWAFFFFQETFPLLNVLDEEEANIDNTSEFIEKEPAGLNVGISIEGLVKHFNTDAGNKTVFS